MSTNNFVFENQYTMRQYFENYSFETQKGKYAMIIDLAVSLSSGNTYTTLDGFKLTMDNITEYFN